MQNIPYSAFKYAVAAMLLASPFTAIVNTARAQVPFSAPPVGAPGSRDAGTARSDTCAMTLNSPGLTAVIPETNVGFTTKERPEFFVYVPANNAEAVEFRLIEEDTGNEVYVGTVSLPMAEMGSDYRYAPSLVSLAVPSGHSPVVLEEGKRYLWALMLVCNSENRAEDIVVTGVVERPDDAYFESLDPTVQNQLSTVNSVAPSEQLIAYGQAGIWHDLLTVLAALVASDPTAYQNDWSTLLTAQGLGAIANTPIVFTEVNPL